MIPGLGTQEDSAVRTDEARSDTADRCDKVEMARKYINVHGYVVNSDRVDDFLKSESLVPTIVSFHLLWIILRCKWPGLELLFISFTRPWARFLSVSCGRSHAWVRAGSLEGCFHPPHAHLALNWSKQCSRVQQAVSLTTEDFSNKLIFFFSRFRQVPTFGKSTICRFANNVSDMKKLAARDFEDILQVIDSNIHPLHLLLIFMTVLHSMLWWFASLTP